MIDAPLTNVNYLKLYFGEKWELNKHITIYHPKLQDVIDMGEQEYYSMVYTLCSIPSDMKSRLFDAGIDYEEISDFELFVLLTRNMTPEVTYPLFGDLDLSSFEMVNSSENGDLILLNETNEGEMVIDKFVYQKIIDYIRAMHYIKPKIEHAANELTKKVLIEYDRSKIALNAKKPYSSTLLPLISSMVNSEGFKYKPNELKEVPIYQFMDSVQRIQAIKTASALLHGAYCGMCDLSKIPKEDFNWMRDLTKR